MGSWTPGGQAGSSDAGISSALTPGSVGGIPGARPGRGLWKALCLSWPLCLLPFAPSPPPPPAGFGQRPGGGGLCRVLQVAPDPGLFGAESLQPAGPAALPHAGSTPSSLFYFLLVSSSDSS